MKLTCLNKGDGYHFPPCHILNICGFRILFDCPLDLSALTIFSPVPIDSYQTQQLVSSLVTEYRYRKRRRIEKLLDANSLIFSEPWFKTVNSLHLWDISFIDIVLLSSPMGMLGLPFLTRHKNFNAKIYVTEASARIGQLMMEDLVSMHMEFRQCYGPAEDSGFPQWMKWEELEMLPPALKEIVMGVDGEELGSWQLLYSAADVDNCMKKVQTLKYAEEVCHNGTLIIKGFSSGLEIGTCNWTITGPRRNIAYVSSSIVESATAMNFDYRSLQGVDVILFSDFSSLHDTLDSKDTEETNNLMQSETNKPTAYDFSPHRDDIKNEEQLINSLLNTDGNSEEMDKLAFICSCVIDSVKEGGSVLIPIGRLGIILQLMEQLSPLLESLNLKVPIFLISSVAEEMLAFTNIVPEWLCKQRQEKLYSGEALFGHVQLLKEKKLHLFPEIHSPSLLTAWEEPCIVFSPHWSLRLGPVVHLVRRWCADQHCLLILEDDVDAELALLPFKPMAMKVLRCSFLSGIKMQKILPLLELLQPKLVLLPEDLMTEMLTSKTSLCSFLHYSENETLRFFSSMDDFEADLATDLALNLQPIRMEHQNMALARLEGELHVDQGKHFLVSAKKPDDSSKSKSLLHWGSLDPNLLLLALQENGVNGYLDEEKSDAGEQSARILHLYPPNKALIEISSTRTVISTDDENLASIIFKVVSSVLEGI